MAWTTDLVLMLRYTLGDLDSSSYTDSVLQKTLTIAGYHVYSSATFDTAYTFNISSSTISPDPFTTDDKDFCVLTLYKAACMIATYELKEEGGFSMKDGPTSITVDSQNNKNAQLSQKTFCEMYDSLLKNYLIDGGVFGSGGPGAAVLGPYSPGGDLLAWYAPNNRGLGWQ